MKIQNRLLLSILPVVFITVSLVTGTAIYISTNAMNKQVKENAQLLSESYSNELNSKVIQIKRMSQDLAASVVTAVNVETVLINTRKRYPEISRILYTSLYGDIKDLSPYSSSLFGSNYKDNEGWINAVKNQKPIISNPTKYLGEDVFFIYSPVIIDYVANIEPQVIGVVVIVIPVDYVFNQILDVVFGDTGSVFVANSDGSIISHKEKSYIMNKKVADIPSTTNLDQIENAMTDMNFGIGSYYVGATKNLISFSPVSSVGWSLALTGSYKEFTKDVYKLTTISIFILIISLILGSLTIYIIVHGITLPITTLSNVAQKISDGDMSLRSKLKTKNEIGQLSKIFDVMVDRLSDYNKSLEHDVLERTKELQVINEELEATNEELATINEILDANAREIEMMNEELVVTNETLDSNAKEMEAMNEELKSSNENMESINEELIQTVEELDATNKQLERTKDALWSEMELAQKLQTVLLPVEPKINGFDISAFMNTTDSVGGDYYDVINVEGKDWFLIGDVSGHGVTAGLIMMMVQTSIHVALSQNPTGNPGDLLSIINKTIHSNISKLGGNRYMTLTVFACLDDNKFSFAGAHLPVIIYRTETDTLEMIETPGAWIGLVESVEDLNDNNEFMMNNGDVILLYTDGISEAITQTGEQFTQKSLAELFKSYVHLDAKGICEHIKDYTEKLSVDDDVTVMVLKKV